MAVGEIRAQISLMNQGKPALPSKSVLPCNHVIEGRYSLDQDNERT